LNSDFPCRGCPSPTPHVLSLVMHTTSLSFSISALSKDRTIAFLGVAARIFVESCELVMLVLQILNNLVYSCSSGSPAAETLWCSGMLVRIAEHSMALVLEGCVALASPFRHSWQHAQLSSLHMFRLSFWRRSLSFQPQA
jgi:hypothetical protein